MKKNAKSIIICLLLLTGVLLYFLSARYLPIQYTEILTGESPQPIKNPYRGFYHLYGYCLSEDDLSKPETWCNTILTQDNKSLVLLQINLKNYKNSALSSQALNQLNLILKEFSAADKQLILRFIYDWDGKGIDSEPDTREQIAGHMLQVSSIVNAYHDHIFLIQGIGTGSYGEMAATSYGTASDMIYLMNQQADAFQPDIFLSVRTPAQLRSILNTHRPLSASIPYDKTLAARLGLYNDGMLGSVYDLGTYDDTSYLKEGHYTEAGTRQEELDFQNQLCNFVPNGGEVVSDNEYNDIENAVKDLKTMHITYLNRDYDVNVLKKWAESTYDGVNGLDYIDAHLGYRYLLTESSIDYHPLFDEECLFTLTIKNTGFAPAYKRFESTILLTNTDSGETLSFPTQFDNRTLFSEETQTLKLSIPVRDLPVGEYEITFIMSDNATGLPITLANEESGLNTNIGTLTIR